MIYNQGLETRKPNDLPYTNPYHIPCDVTAGNYCISSTRRRYINMNDFLDLVDEMQWEDSEKIEFLTLEQAGLESYDVDTVPACNNQEYFRGEQ